MKSFILTLTCKYTRGIVAGVTATSPTGAAISSTARNSEPSAACSAMGVKRPEIG